MRNKYLEQIAELNPNAVRYSNYDDAIIGIVNNQNTPVLLYSTKKCLDLSINGEEAPYGIALEHIEYFLNDCINDNNNPVFLMDEV